MITRKHPSSSTAPPSQISIASNQPSEQSSGKRSQRLAIAGGIGAFLVAALLVFWIVVPSIGESEIVVGEKVHTIQLDVLNATGESRLAQRMTDFLRAKGFDVVEMGNYKESDIGRTLVIDRSGNRQAAIQVAQALGVPEQQVVQKIDKSLFLDVSVIIGKDYKALFPFK